MTLLNDLKLIDNEFSLVSNFETIEENIDELFSLCKQYLGQEILFCAPYFYKLEDWDTWKISPIVDYRYFSYVAESDFDNRLSIQNSYLTIKNQDGINGFILRYKQHFPSQKRINICLSNDKYNIDGSSDIVYIRINNEQIAPYNIIDSAELRETDYQDLSSSEIIKHIEQVEVQITNNPFFGQLGHLEEAARAHAVFLPNQSRIYYIYSDIYNRYNEQFQKISYGLGGIFVIINTLFTPIEEEQCVKLLQSLSDKLANRIIQIYYRKKLQRESLKSAVSAIMTRNMSHNLGSHYLHYTKSHLEQLANRGGNFGPDIRGAAKVMGYMQGRMDYLATLVSMDRYPYGCVNFKSQIFDELTIDDFSKRHFEKDIISNDEVRNVIVLLKRLQREDNKSKIVKANLESLYELSKKALTNKSHNRTTNFLLTNLILSENFTRPSILDDNSSSSSDLKMINLQVLLDLKDEDEESYTKIFTGSLAKKDDEEIVKRKLSEINIALPGGVMSSHAFFNIVENFIRNSAKYLQTDFSKSGNLTITIKITEIDGYYEFTLFDDKQNANKVQPNTTNSLLENLKNKIRKLHVLDKNNALDKKDKGFKEMLFSALWLRSYTYQNISDNDLPQSYEEVLVKIESAKDTTDERIILIKQYGFELLAVDDNGNETKEDNANLALRLSLPKFCPKTMMELSDNALQVNLSNLLHIYADVAMIDAKQYTSFVEQLNKKRRTEEKDTYDEDMIIPRLLKHKNELSNVEALNEVLHARFGDDFDNYQIVSGSFENDNLSTPIADNKKIYYQRHLSTQDVIDHYKGYAYADSVSGGNYTITLFDLYERWAKEGRKTDSEYYCQILKIKESALTRITIIDERFFKKMKEQQLETELACKNIRVLNYNDSMSKETEMAKLLEGNEFNNHENHTHFLSIHLGIIEKIVKNVDMFKKMENSNEKVKVFMKMLKEYFGPKVFISIHSGRGNFSAELEDALDMYPFISMAALENAYENSKYLLAQLFYSTIYIGKGVANHDN